MTVRSRIASGRDAVRTQLWPIPTMGIVLALVAGVFLPDLDRAIDDNLPDRITAYLFGGGASAARTVLDAIASSLITVTSLTFSLTVVTLQLASGQFSPRLLRTFTRDRFVHVTLAIFLSTFVYALTVLRTVRSSDEEQDQFVPQISVSVAFVLAVGSVVALVLFLAHLAREIRVETMLRTVHSDASATVTKLLTRPDSSEQPQTPSAASVLPPPAHARMILAHRSGFLTAIDGRALCKAAEQSDAVVLIAQLPGGFVAAGTPLGCYWSSSKPDHPADMPELADALPATLTIGVERTDAQDFAFGLRQLSDVTVKALSPGINDPTTAVHSLGHTSALVCEIARADLEHEVLQDGDGTVRVVRKRPTFAQILQEAVTQPRLYGAADPLVMSRLVGLLREVAWSVSSPHQRAAVSTELGRLRKTIADQNFDHTQQGDLDRDIEQVQDALAGRWKFAE